VELKDAYIGLISQTCEVDALFSIKNEGLKCVMTLTTTDNSLADVIRWINEGNFVCIYAGDTSRTYCNVDTPTNVVFIEVVPQLLVDGEWNYYIEGAGCKISTQSALDLARFMPDRVLTYSL
jgi:hypothetical protein